MPGINQRRILSLYESRQFIRRNLVAAYGAISDSTTSSSKGHYCYAYGLIDIDLPIWDVRVAPQARERTRYYVTFTRSIE